MGIIYSFPMSAINASTSFSLVDQLVQKRITFLSSSSSSHGWKAYFLLNSSICSIVSTGNQLIGRRWIMHVDPFAFKAFLETFCHFQGMT